MGKAAENNQGFSSAFGFIMTAVGCALGIGTLWRFPYMLGENGGAAFLVLYIIMLFVIGVPLLVAEMSVGFKAQKTAIQAYKTLAPGTKWHWAGILHTIAAIIMIGYTIPIYSAIWEYIYKAAVGFFNGMNATEIANFYTTFNADKPLVVILALGNYLLTYIIIQFGLQKGAETVAKYLLPALAVIMIVIIIFGLQLDGAMDGVSFIFTPDFSAITGETVVACAGQIFFALGLAMLASMVFGSYVKDPKENLSKSAIIICAAILFTGLCAAMMIFPMVFHAGLEPSQGPGLVFIIMPQVFNSIPAGQIIGPLFYFGFYIAAITSLLGVFEAVTSIFQDELHLNRRVGSTVAMIPVAALGIISCIFDDVFNFMDMFESNYVLIASGLCISIFCGWYWGADNFLDAANVKNAFMRNWIKVCVKFVAPIIIVAVFITSVF